MPRKSVAGSLPWKPMSPHCLVMRSLSGTEGRRWLHSSCGQRPPCHEHVFMCWVLLTIRCLP